MFNTGSRMTELNFQIQFQVNKLMTISLRRFSCYPFNLEILKITEAKLEKFINIK